MAKPEPIIEEAADVMAFLGHLTSLEGDR